MDAIETAAADTTSDHSSPSHMHYNKEPHAKRPKMDHSQLVSELHGLRHYSGRLIGIAQPFRPALQESEGDLKSFKSGSERNPTPPASMSYENKHLKGVVDDTYDSDQSQKTTRFNRFANESTVETRRSISQSDGEHLSDSESQDSDSSSSSSNFEFPFAPPSTSTDEETGMEPGHGGMEPGQPGDGKEEHHQLTRKTSSAILDGTPPLPPGKKWHVFVTHSTGDKQWAREAIIIPLRSPPHNMQVAASYNFMPDSSRYDDRAIRNSIQESCVVIVGLSPAYVNSQRCSKEWQLAVQLAQELGQCQVIVAAAAPCSRPEPLKEFLYLDFMDKKKCDTVWSMLLQAINTKVEYLIPPSSPTTNRETEPGLPSQQEDEPSYQKQESSCSDHSPSNSDDGYLGYNEQYQQRMAAEFEEEFRQYDTEPAQQQEEPSVPLDPRLIDIASTDQVVSQEHESAEEEEEEHQEVKGHVPEVKGHMESGKEGEDMEEGEVNDSSEEDQQAITEEHSQSKMVASFYNELSKPDADKRNESPIFHMRNFNNWVKSILIRSHLSELRLSATVLDLCCGKGGDLLKWKEGGIDYLVAADISETAVEQCKDRYRCNKMLDRSTREPPYHAEFIVADCCQVRLRDMYENPARRFHLSSCQFSLHYSFEKYERAHMMLRNACENLRPGGYFIGTTIDSNEVIRRLREKGKGEDGTWSIGNDIFSLRLDSDHNPWEKLPLFGTKYYFRLHGVVDLPEFIVHFPLLVSMLKDFDMECILQQNFYNFFMERRHNTEDIHLMFRMQAFDKHKGTMSSSQWEVIGLYLVFVFRKRDPLPPVH